ncbi:hypothetical protein MW887_011744 [Aspergillus wentii]|nr:hypothetical protein MW887_011744 [Aspergillus wentii]
MDRSLDEIIAERPQQRQNRGGRRPQGQGQGQGRRRDGVKKFDFELTLSVFLRLQQPQREDRVDLDLDWVHDKYEDDRETRPSRGARRPRGDRYSPPLEHGNGPSGSKIRVENIHYDITESDLEELFNQIGPVTNLSLVYDRAGRSEGLAFVTYNRASDARTAISEFDGANAKGQPIRLTLIASGAGRRDRNPFDNVERPRGSLMDRVERPRDSRSLSPGGDGDGERRRGGRRGAAGGGRGRRSDVSKPAPENIDRYVPGQRQRSPARRGGNGRRRDGRRDNNTNDNNRSDGRRTVNGRPRKTQEELDQEMEDYWGGANGGAETADKPAAVPEEPQQAAAPATTAPAGDDDVDMIE